MTVRTSQKTVVFTRPFVLNGIIETQPAGDYIVETDEELLEGISFPAYRRVLTLIHLHEKPNRPGVRETLTIDPEELEAALKRDLAEAEIMADGDCGAATTNQKLE